MHGKNKREMYNWDYLIKKDKGGTKNYEKKLESCT